MFFGLQIKFSVIIVLFIACVSLYKAQLTRFCFWFFSRSADFFKLLKPDGTFPESLSPFKNQKTKPNQTKTRQVIGRALCLFYCRLNETATARGFLSVREATLDVHYRPVASCSVGSETRNIFSAKKSLQCSSFFLFNVKMPSGSAKIPGAAASVLVFLVAARLAVTSCVSAFSRSVVSGAAGSSYFQLLSQLQKDCKDFWLFLYLATVVSSKCPI